MFPATVSTRGLRDMHLRVKTRVFASIFRVYLSLVPVVHNRRIPGARCFAHSGCSAVTDVTCHFEKSMFRYLRRAALRIAVSNAFLRIQLPLRVNYQYNNACMFCATSVSTVSRSSQPLIHFYRLYTRSSQPSIRISCFCGGVILFSV